MTFGIVHQDDEVLVVHKRAGLVTQPGKGHEDDTLLNGLFHQFGTLLQNLGAARDYGLLHRLDRETSGLLIVALRARAYDALRTQFVERKIRKFYWAIVSRAPKQPDGVIDRAIAETDPKSMGEKKLARLAPESRGGKPAQTAFRVLAATDLGALLECRPLSGRLHQVRVHLESINCPILGDGLYGTPQIAAISPRLALHAHRLAFVHPTTGQTIDVRSEFPKDLRGVLRKLKLPVPSMVTKATTQVDDEA